MTRVKFSTSAPQMALTAWLGLAVVATILVAPAFVVVGAVLWIVGYAARRTTNLVGCLIYFGVLGPLFGFLTYWPMAHILESDAVSLSGVLGSFMLGAAFSVALWILALPLGALPALLTGFAYWTIRRRLGTLGPRFLPFVSTIIIGTFASALWTAAALEQNLTVLTLPDHWLRFALPGAVATSLCAIAVELRLPPPGDAQTHSNHRRCKR